MRSIEFVVSLFVLATLAPVGMPNARASESDWDTFMTFSAPVEIPGMVLAPGKYEFRILDYTGSGYLVVVRNSDGDYLEAIQAESIHRTKTTDKTVVNLEIRNPKSPEAIKSWFYPGEDYGVEFVYPKPNKSASTS